MKFAKKKMFFKIFIILVIFSTTNIYSQHDNSDDAIENKWIFSYYSKEKYIFVFDNIYHYSNLLNNEVDLLFKFPFKNIYTFDFWINDQFLINFNQIQIAQSEGIVDTASVLSSMFNNYFSTGFDNKIRIKPVMNIYFNLDAGLNTPFNDYLSFIINPLTIRFEGDYYFGFNWEIEESIPIVITPQIENDIVFSPSSYFKLAYEFFRFYGPKSFRFTILADDYLTFSIPYLLYDKTYDNMFSAGLIFNFFIVSPSIYFILNTNGYLSDTNIIYNYIGFKTGVSFYIKRFIFSLDYSGYTDAILPYTNWINRFDAYFKVIIDYKKKE